MDEETRDSLLITESTQFSIQEMAEFVMKFQGDIAGLQRQISNKSFGSKVYQAYDTIAAKGRFVAGNNNDIAIMDGGHPTWRLWIGHKTPTSAPFRVDKDGNMVATSVTLSGYIQAGGAASDINANSTTISGGKITTGSITADRMSVSTLSAISANMGTITAGTMTGGTIQTASSSLRVVISPGGAGSASNDSIKFMNGSTVYSTIEPLVFPQGFGINMATVSEDAFLYMYEGTNNAAGFGTTGASIDILNSTIYMNGTVSFSSSISASNLSGTNTGDETGSSIRSKLGGLTRTTYLRHKDGTASEFVFTGGILMSVTVSP
jgi:hypothetical protein